jgi:hypothetical protein
MAHNKITYKPGSGTTKFGKRSKRTALMLPFQEGKVDIIG